MIFFISVDDFKLILTKNFNFPFLLGKHSFLKDLTYRILKKDFNQVSVESKNKWIERILIVIC
jgi:hypothetical protein